MTVTDSARPLILPEMAIERVRRVTRQFDTRQVGADRRQMSAWSRDRGPNRKSRSGRYFYLSGDREMKEKEKAEHLHVPFDYVQYPGKRPFLAPIHESQKPEIPVCRERNEKEKTTGHHRNTLRASLGWLSLGQYGHLNRLPLLSRRSDSSAMTCPHGIIIGGFWSVACSFETGQTKIEWKR